MRIIEKRTLDSWTFIADGIYERVEVISRIFTLLFVCL